VGEVILGARYIIGIVASVLLGFILLASGVGKLFMGIPSQMEFLSQISPVFGIPDSWLMILIYILPWVEITIGMFLLLQIYIQIVAVICVPLIIAFMTNNIWMVLNGNIYDHCNSCFGIFEQYIGGMTPIQALAMDCIMLLLAVVVIFASTKYKILWGLLND